MTAAEGRLVGCVGRDSGNRIRDSWMEIVPPHVEACDVCAGKKDRPRPKPGERWSARETVRRICRACYAEFVQDVGVERRVGAVRRKLQLPTEPDTSSS